MSCDNSRPCPCTYDCPRHGRCCACVAHHRDHDEGVPGCFFSPEAEATYDRSIEALARDKGIIRLSFLGVGMRRLLGVAVLVLLLAGCATTDAGRSPVEGKKVAYVLNMARSDIFTDAAAGAVDTARALGMRCTVYFTGGDDALFISYVNTLAAEGYDGLFLSHGGREYSHSLISSVLLLYPQLSIVTFDTELIGPEGEPEAIDGVTQFFQDDRELATILLDFIIEEVESSGEFRFKKPYVYMVKYVAPIMLALVLFSGLFMTI